MFLIAADIGNSSTKLSIGEVGDMRFVAAQAVFRGDDEISIALPDEHCFWSICSVNQIRCDALVDWIGKQRRGDQYHIIGESDVELKSAVKNRRATGRDRLVAAFMAANLASKESPYIVVDAGTAVTIDFVSADRTFMGGVIFPGASSLLKHLADSTDALPDLTNEQNWGMAEIFADVVGTETKSAILKGVFHTQLAGITAIVEKISDVADKNCEVFATGGGIERIRDFLPGHWNIVPNLVLQGAFSIGESLIEKSQMESS